MSNFPIQKGIAISARRPGKHNPKYPWADLTPGDSFFVPANGKNPAHIVRRMHQGYRAWLFSRHMFAHQRPITIRTVVEDGVPGVRIWRVKPLGAK